MDFFIVLLSVIMLFAVLNYVIGATLYSVYKNDEIMRKVAYTIGIVGYSTAIIDFIIRSFTMKPFNLEEAKAGKPVCTKFGRFVKIISYEDEEEIEYPIRALIYVTKEDSINIVIRIVQIILMIYMILILKTVV